MSNLIKLIGEVTQTVNGKEERVQKYVPESIFINSHYAEDYDPRAISCFVGGKEVKLNTRTGRVEYV